MQEINISQFIQKIWSILRSVVLLIVLMVIIGGAASLPNMLSSSVHTYTREIEFDFGGWTLEAIAAKIANWALSIERFTPPDRQSEIVLDYLGQVRKLVDLQNEMVLAFSDPNLDHSGSSIQSLRDDLNDQIRLINELAPIAESILQSQLMDILRESNLDVLKQVLPPSLFRASDVPLSLVVSPRSEILQIVDVSLVPGMTVEGMAELESRILEDLDHAALIVPIGGIGTYPTMVMQTTDLVWLTEVIAHEWVHNFLTLHPLGINYFTNDELRTMNETTASLAGKEIGRLILKKYYPDHLPPEQETTLANETPPRVEQKPEESVFDFQREMRITRVETERLLSQGEIEAAEAFMEMRRQYFWDNGYAIRKINQAYFAFYGAYNDQPGGGAAGEDPIGPAVVAFRAQHEGLSTFLRAIARVNSFEELQRMLDT
jgi:hypothetical protein